MAFELESHTADMRIVSRGDSLEEAFSEASRAFRAIMIEQDVSEKVVYSLELSAESKEALFFEFVDELVFLLDTQGFVPARTDIDIIELAGQWVLNGVIRGDAVSSYDHHGDVKAPTYHELSVKQDGPVWVCSIVVDL